MLIGYPPRPQGDFEIQCNRSGCGTKGMRIQMSLAGMTRDISFVGATFPRFEDPPRTLAYGADLPLGNILRVKWDRLTFYGQDKFWGPIEINILHKPSLGRVYSLANPTFNFSESWFYRTDVQTVDGFFPAHNENHLFFEVFLRRFGVRFRNRDPVVNGAIIDRIPPEGIEYSLKAPVLFQSQSKRMPFGVEVKKCRMAMSVLKDVELSVTSFAKTGENTARVVVTAANKSPVDRVTIGFVADSTSNIIASPMPQFARLDRIPKTFTIDLDISRAVPPGFIVLSFVLIEPLESPGSNRLTIDYDEIRLGRNDPESPSFTSGFYQPSRLRNLES